MIRRRLRDLPLRYTLPFLVVSIGFVSIAASYLLTRSLAVEQILDEQTRFAQEQMGRFQLILESTAEASGPAFAQELMSLAASSNLTLRFVITNADDEVIASSSFDEVGVNLDELFQDTVLELSRQAKGQLRPIEHYQADREVLTTVGRLCKTRTFDFSAEQDCGVVLFQRDLSLVIDEHFVVLNRQLQITSAGILFTVLAILWVIRSALLAKIQQLQRVLSRYEAGDAGQRSQFEGNNEIARIGTAIDELLDHVESAQDALAFSEQRFRALFENNIEGMVVMTEQGFITDINNVAAQTFGYERQELMGSRVERLMPEDHAEKHSNYVGNFLSTGEAKIIGQSRQLKGIRKSGEEFPIKLGVGEVTSGHARYFVGTITDLTHVEELEQQVRRSQKMDAIGQLAGGIAHDFNNLLGIMIGNLDLLRRTLPKDSKSIKYADKALGAATRGADLTRRLLSFSRKKAGSTEAVDVDDLLNGLKDLIERSMTSSIGVSITGGNNLWAVEVDRGQLEDVLVNLSLNARDAMPSGGRLIIEASNVTLDSTVPLDICGSDAVGEYVQISVSDTGHGIDPDMRDKIFEPFFSTKEEGKGTGLGLAMVYSFLKRFRGCLSLYSEVGMGTTFRLYLPRATGSQPVNKPQELADTPLPGGSETILLVDDEPELLEMVDDLLSGLGYATLTAGNGEQALAVLEQRHDVDMLFSDVVMPGAINGFALALQVRERWPHIKILLASGFTGKLIADEDHSEWQDVLMSKPYRDIEVAQRVRALLDEGAQQ